MLPVGTPREPVETSMAFSQLLEDERDGVLEVWFEGGSETSDPESGS